MTIGLNAHVILKIGTQSTLLVGVNGDVKLRQLSFTIGPQSVIKVLGSLDFTNGKFILESHCSLIVEDQFVSHRWGVLNMSYGSTFEVKGKVRNEGSLMLSKGSRFSIGHDAKLNSLAFSNIVVSSGSVLDIAADSKLYIRRGLTLYIDPNAQFQLLDGLLCSMSQSILVPSFTVLTISRRHYGGNTQYRKFPRMNVQPSHSPFPHSVCLCSSSKVASLFLSPPNTAIGDAGEEEKELPPAQALDCPAFAHAGETFHLPPDEESATEQP